VSPVQLAPHPTSLDAAELPLVVQRVSKQWRRAPARVLDEVDLSVGPGTAVWIGGDNGVGKTTLLRIVGGIIDADSGSIAVCGVRPKERRRYHRLIGFLSAGDRGLYARLTVRQQLEFCAAVALLPRAEAAAAVERAIDRFELEELRDRRLDRLSMGQRQRVRVAMAFLHEPRLVLLDEPGNSLDAAGLALLEAAIRELVRGGGAAVWCSPAWDGAGYDFDAAYVLERGRLRPA
jgi:ABC-type multidrug transport system ATPase subunit